MMALCVYSHIFVLLRMISYANLYRKKKSDSNEESLLLEAPVKLSMKI